MIPRIALVTGWTGALGAAVTVRLLEAGHEVHGFAWRTCDVSSAQDVNRYMRKLGHVSTLVNCAAVDRAPASVEVNLLGTMYMSRACIDAGCSRIINIAGGGVGGPSMHPCAEYVASKAGVIVYTEAMAKTWPNVYINCVSPGPFRSAMNPTSDGTPDRAVELIAWLASEECKVTGRMFGAQHWKKGDMGGALRWTACE